MKKTLSTLLTLAICLSLIPSASAVITNNETISSTVQIQIKDSTGEEYIGSGVVISIDAYVLTSAHVIMDDNTNEPAKDIYICTVETAYDTPNCQFKAEVIAYDTDYDLALIAPNQYYDQIKEKTTGTIDADKLEGLKLPYVDFADTFPSLGEKISILGYPQANISGSITLTEGTISGFIPLTNNIVWYIITDATGNPGNSGGPAYNSEEKLIGILESISTEGEGGNYSYISSEDVIATWFNKLVSQEILNIDFVNEIFSNDFINNNNNLSTEIFNDVELTSKNAEAISYLKNQNIINGYSDGSFKAENSLNRAELLKILVEGAGYTPDESKYKNCFPDVQDQWYAKYICYAKEREWIKGYDDGSFKPANDVSKAESLKMLLEIFNIVSDSNNSKAFNDIDTTQWYAKYVSKAKELGILEETSNLYHPSDNMNRGKISENIYRLLILEKQLFTAAQLETTCAVGAEIDANENVQIENNIPLMAKIESIYSSYGFDTKDLTSMNKLSEKYQSDKEVEMSILNSIDQCNDEAIDEELSGLLEASYNATCALSQTGTAPYHKTLEMVIETGDISYFQAQNIDVKQESVKEHIVTTYNDNELVQNSIDQASTECTPSI